MPRRREDFKAGDRVRLIAPFRCSGDRAELDEGIDATLKEANPHEILGTVTSNDRGKWVEVLFDNPSRYGNLAVDAEVLDFEITESDIEDAIRSIQEAQGGQS